jgi:hypothetical protein
MFKIAFTQMEKTLDQTQKAFTVLEDQDRQRLATI